MSTISPAKLSSFTSGSLTNTLEGSGICFSNKSSQGETVVIGKQSSNNIISTSADADSVTVSGHGHRVSTGAGADGVVLADSCHARLNTGDGDDQIIARGSNHGTYVHGGAGSDTLQFDSPSSAFHVRDSGNFFEFVQKGGNRGLGALTFVAKDIEVVTFADGRSFTRDQLAQLTASASGSLVAGGPVVPSSAQLTSVAAGSLAFGSQFADNVTIRSATTLDSGAGNDVINDTTGYRNVINTGSGNDSVSGVGDWFSRTDLGDGDDRLNLGSNGLGPGGGYGFHDAGTGHDSLTLSGRNFVVRARVHGGFDIERDSVAASTFVNFERFELGGRTFSAAELGAAVAQSGGRLVLGNDRVKTGTAGADVLTINNDQYSSVSSGLGDDVLNLSGLFVAGDGGAGNDVFNIRNSRVGYNRVTANGGVGDDFFNIDDRANQSRTNLHAINGGEGRDVAQFLRNASEYRLSEVRGTSVLLTHIASGARARLTDVEVLQFNGGTSYTLSELQAMFADRSQSERGEISVRLQDRGAAPSTAWTVQDLGAGLFSVYNGTLGFVVRDKGGDGIGDDDLVLRAKRGDASVMSHVVGRAESLTTSGDRVENVSYSRQSSSRVAIASQALLDDIRDGRLDDSIHAFALSEALDSGRVEVIGTLPVDAAFLLSDNQTRIVRQVVGGNDVMFSRAFDIQFADGRAFTFSGLGDDTGGGGLSAANASHSRQGRALAAGSTLPTFVEMGSASLLIAGSTAEVGPIVNGGRSAGVLADERGAVLGVGTAITARAQSWHGALGREVPLEFVFGLRSPDNV